MFAFCLWDRGMVYISLFWACTVTTESPLLNVSFVLEITLISEPHWQVLQGSVITCTEKKRNIRGEEQCVTDNYLQINGCLGFYCYSHNCTPISVLFWYQTTKKSSH